jgi:Tol biopolymer transport system component
MKSRHILLLAIGLLATPTISSAQYWRALPALSPETSQILSFSQDEKYVIYAATENGVSNVYRVSVKGGTPEAVTSFTDGKVLRPISTVGKNWVVFMRPTVGESDYHLFRTSQDGKIAPQDVTPTKAGVNNVIVGASYNGRYVYYTSNQTSADKNDVYRYDVWQNISELVFANPKDFKPVSWNKEQTKVTLRDPSTSKMTMYDINTTEITDNTDINDDPIAPERSINGRFGIIRRDDGVNVLDVQTKEPVTLEAVPAVVGIAPKETQIAYTVTQRDGSTKLFIYDVAKKTSTMLTVMK